MDLEKKIAGLIKLDGEVSITDPCYDKDVWCRINGVKIVPGEYLCVAWISDEGAWGKRVAKLGVYLNGNIPDPFDLIPLKDEVCVDAGLAGVYSKKPDFTDDEWSEFCNKIYDGSYWVNDGWFDGRLVGFTTSSGYGDGGYTAYVAEDNDGRAWAVEIVFIEDDAEEEEDEDEWEEGDED